MCVLFQVNVDPTLQPEDLKGNVAVPAILYQGLLQRETSLGFVYCRDSEPAHATMAHWG